MKSKFISELIGTTFLLMIVVGSGIMGENLSRGNVAMTLLVNSLATGLGLFVLIQNLGPISGAHFNPVVSFVEFLGNRLKKKELIFYCIAQFIGAIIGVFLTHLMFNQDLFQISMNPRNGIHFLVSEFIATFGLICTIALAGRKHGEFAPFTISAYITSAYWFTSSTSFANPAVTFARTFTNTFCGIMPSSVAMFILAQFIGAFFSFFLLRNLRDV